VRPHNQPDGYQQQNKASARLALWTFAWAATLAVARFGPERLWDSDLVSWIAVAANIAVGIGWIVAYARYLQAIDELHRKINQDALSVTLGVGFVGGFAYVVADNAGLVTRDVDVAVLPVALAVVYILAIVVGYLRYR
jgi:hypothetical protein